MNPRQAKLLDAAEACRNAARMLELDYPLSELEDPMLTRGRRELIQLRQRDIASLKLAGATAMSLAADPENFALLLNLRVRSLPAFDAIMVLARQELARAEQAPAEDAA